MKDKSRRIQFNVILIVAVLLWSAASVALAQETQTGGVTADEVNAVARELWCPLCSGVRLDSCELKACDQMKDVIAIKLAEGEDTESIKAYFVEQYGPQVLGEPPREGFNWLAWILPVVALVFGGVFVWRQAGRMMRGPAGDGDEQVDAQTAGSTRLPLAEAHPRAANDEAEPGPQDEYERKLEEELTRYG